MDIQKTLLSELKKTKYSRYQIAKITGIEPATLCRFVNGERTITLKNAEKLLTFFGYKSISKRK